MLSEDVMLKFNNQLRLFVENGFKQRDYPQWFHEQVMEEFGFNKETPYETFFTNAFLNSRTQLQFLNICQHHGYPNFLHMRKKLERRVRDLEEMRDLDREIFSIQ